MADTDAEDIAKVRRYFDKSTNDQVDDNRIQAELIYFARDSQRHMLAARAIVRSMGMPRA